VQARKHIELAPCDGMDVYDEDTGMRWGSMSIDSYDDWEMDEYTGGADPAECELMFTASGRKPDAKHVNLDVASGGGLLDGEVRGAARRRTSARWSACGATRCRHRASCPPATRARAKSTGAIPTRACMHDLCSVEPWRMRSTCLGARVGQACVQACLQKKCFTSQRRQDTLNGDYDLT
jgi:hypothetical protein